MKDIEQLDQELSYAIRKFRNKSLSTNASQNAPIDKRNLKQLQDETTKALTEFKDAILHYLSE